MAKRRKEKFLETAMKLFAEKGYHTTSIQDIVEAWGISKGAFYHHFSSKEELMLEIVRYHFEKLMAPVEEKQKHQPPRDAFIDELTKKLEGILKHKDFFQMMMVEQLPKINADIQRYLYAQRARMFRWYCQRLIDIYGKKIEKHVFDVAAIVNGIFREYLFYMMVNQEMFRADAIARFIVRQMDAIVAHLGEEEPLLTEAAMRCFADMAEQEHRERKAKIFESIAQLKQQLSTLPLDKKTHHQLHAALDTLEAEFSQEETTPREYVVKGILLYIDNQQLPSLADALVSLTKLVHEYMTHDER
ncbi:AcrR family transcriptional regulator [Anoxybacillus voinovskiensis]|uniref:AcrR family transcriptional regulator n=1 Tax=Anoxybacteroides voinovskiense TaxID=230470 RepID=A0A840DYK8_9BACL|nr:TetR/AcrR family transcriptional regulator [Anoxybacillus voinovskiensis]MBB4075058.1 AcrR family transcriptional regulator [Anoxybacillus voinovskiensis]GGJ76515.1 TetR family transcriptional regulator [Anoxybacillus voinovskiensis]